MNPILIGYAILYIPFFNTIREYTWAGATAFGIYFLYVGLSSRMEKIKHLLPISIVALGYITKMSGNYDLLYPMALFPFIINWTNNESGFDKFSMIAVLLTAASTFFGEGTSGSIEEKLAFYAPAIYSLVFPLIASRMDFEDNEEYEPDTEKDERIAELEEKVRQLQLEKSKKKALPPARNKLAAVIELDYEGFDRDSAIRKTLAAIKNSTDSIFAAMYRFDENMFFLEAVTGKPPMSIPKEVPMGKGIVGQTILTGKHVYANHLKEKNMKVDGLLAIPVISGEMIVGAISLGLYEMNEKQEKDTIALCTSIADKLGKELEKIEEHGAIEYKSRTDELTKVGNRQYFDEQIESLFASGKTFAYVLLDLDFFKQMNDTHGHDFGDKVLKAAANTFASSVRANDQVFRTGGDEFSLLLVDADKKEAYSVMKRIKESYAAVVEKEHFYALKDGQEVKSSLSCGAAVYPHDNVSTPEELIKLADSAVYYVKEHGKNNFAIAK